MSIKIRKDGQVGELILPADSIQVLDIEGRFNSKNLEDVLKEVGSGTETNMTRIEEELNTLNTQLDTKANIKNTCEYINAGAFGIYKNDKTKDSTKGINDAIAYCKSIGGGTVLIPAGTYLINDSIIVPAEVFLKGSGKCHEGGTVLWRNENTNIINPFIILGSASGSSATLLGGISDFTIIGYSSYEAMEDFISGKYSIIDGEVSQEFNKNYCVINSELATINGINITDIISKLQSQTTELMIAKKELQVKIDHLENENLALKDKLNYYTKNQ